MNRTRICRSCKTQIPQRAKYCPKCGQVYSASVVDQSFQQRGDSEQAPLPGTTHDSTRTPASIVIGSDNEREAPMRLMAALTGSGSTQRGTYQMMDGFVLNTYTGDVWQMDEQKGVFKLVEKEEPLLTLIERALILSELADAMELAGYELSIQQAAAEQAVDEFKPGTDSAIEMWKMALKMIKEYNERQKQNIESMAGI